MAATKTNPHNIRAMRVAWSRVQAKSCADGSVYIKPRWKKRYSSHGVLVRMYMARMLEEYINGKIKHGS